MPLNLALLVNFHWDLIRITHRTSDKHTGHMQSQLLFLSPSPTGELAANRQREDEEDEDENEDEDEDGERRKGGRCV